MISKLNYGAGKLGLILEAAHKQCSFTKNKLAHECNMHGLDSIQSERAQQQKEENSSKEMQRSKEGKQNC